VSGITVPDRAAYLRVVMNELDRIQSHLLANFSYCYTIEHETLAMYLLNTRERAMDCMERIAGVRVNKAYMIPGVCGSTSGIRTGPSSWRPGPSRGFRAPLRTDV